MINSYLSDKLKVLSFILIILVLYIHSGFHSDELIYLQNNMLVQDFVSGMIGRIAVPLFYIISGYLFFLKVPNGLNSIFDKIKKRISTLLIPYIIGCIFFVLFFLIISLIPGTSTFINTNLSEILPNRWDKILVSIFYNSGGGFPLAFHLWFVRDLLIIVFLSPIWYLFYKLFKGYWVIVVFALNYVNVPYFPIYALLWFSLGGIMSKVNITNVPKYYSICFVLFILLGTLQLIFPSYELWDQMKIIIILLGIIGVWSLYDFLVPNSFVLNNHKYLSIACSFTFFIYLFHEPTLNIVRKALVFILGKNSFGFMISYLLSPWIYSIFTIFIGLFLKSYFSKTYNFITGNR